MNEDKTFINRVNQEEFLKKSSTVLFSNDALIEKTAHDYDESCLLTPSPYILMLIQSETRRNVFQVFEESLVVAIQN